MVNSVRLKAYLKIEYSEAKISDDLVLAEKKFS
jgi:hypothetical protein